MSESVGNNKVRTVSVMLQTLCVPCACRCRYCLLSWAGSTVGADWTRSAAYARRLRDWLAEFRPEVSFNFSFGYSMEHPQLFQAIDLLRELDSVGARFLQMDGMRFRTDEELKTLMEGLSAHGVEELNFTLYGLQAAHDAFAGRPGDYGLLMRSISAARKSGLSVSARIPLTRLSAPQAETLIGVLEAAGARAVTLFVPHGEGRGALLESIRLTLDDVLTLPVPVQERMNRRLYRTEGEWVRGKAFQKEERRALLISLTPENIGMFEEMGFERAISFVEELDDTYYAAIPSLEELAERYGDPDGRAFFRQRDLYLLYQRRWIRERGLSLYDVTDERQCGSRRY